MRFYRYVLKYDKNIAPCVDDGLITLGCCKPKVRGTARPGDLVAGFLPRPAPLGQLAWAGVVARVLDWGEYEAEYRGRLDAVYRRRPDGTIMKVRPNFHVKPGSFEKDTGAPVLVFDPGASWYWGERAGEATALPTSLARLAPSGQGHRVEAEPEDRELTLAWLRGLAEPGVYGRSRHEPYLPVPTA